MKKQITLLMAVFSLTAMAQRKCATMDKVHERMANDPAFAEKHKEMMDYIYNPQTPRNVFNRGINQPATVVTIPVVFHVLYANSAQNVTDAQIQTQLDVLNKDYRKLNTDFTAVVPAAFRPFAADMEIVFCKATRTPAGVASTGIVRKQVSASFNMENNYYKTSGDPAWDPSKYLNVWIGNLGSTILGFAYLPGDAPTIGEDGLCINYTAFGTTGTAVAPFNKGRTATHEIGHYFGLDHPWGDGSCNGDDGVADTPATYQEYYNCPTFPSNTYACTSTTNGSMFMNYMDYVDDACMAFFTAGQKAVVQATLSGPRVSLLTSNGCAALGLNDVEAIQAIACYPNPASKYFMISSPQTQIDEVEIFNDLGQLVKTQKLTQVNNEINIESLATGTYYLRIYNQGEFVKSDKIIKK
ncbi:MAG: T9SS type A sorting domain-containing protein [Bacteroidetes bacterium]|nr:T9SS type A sorting domain-containing protein [Bacteroidota bacterium]